MDTNVTFFNSKINGDIYMRLSPKWKEFCALMGIKVNDNIIAKLLKAFYGLK